MVSLTFRFDGEGEVGKWDFMRFLKRKRYKNRENLLKLKITKCLNRARERNLHFEK